jgi:hypothetical protein
VQRVFTVASASKMPRSSPSPPISAMRAAALRAWKPCYAILPTCRFRVVEADAVWMSVPEDEQSRLGKRGRPVHAISGSIADPLRAGQGGP